MQRITKKSVKLLSGSGVILLFFAVAGSLAMASMRASGSLKGQALDNWFAMLFTVVLGISAYYLALALFSWAAIKKDVAKA